MNALSEAPAKVVLANEPDFALGGLAVSPSAGRVRVNGRHERAEPKVMEVLLVLVRAGGATVSRDQLIEACWEGRIVSDDAIARVIAKVRGLARGLDPAPFALETIPKVGFRLTVGETAAEAQASAPVRRAAWRRPLVLVVAAVLVLAAGIGGWFTWRALDRAVPASQNGRLEVVRFDARGADPALNQLSADVGDTFVRVLAAAGDEVAPRVAERAGGESANDAEMRVTGSVDREGDLYVVNAQVLDRRTGLVLISARFDHPSNAPLQGFAEDAAGGLAAGLQCALEDRRWAHRRVSPEVFALYVATCDSLTREGNISRMLQSARRLVRAAPDLAIGQAMYAIAQAKAADEAATSPDEAEALRRGARTTAELAIRLDPKTPKAYLGRAISYSEGGHWAEREADLRKVREVDPNMNPGRLSYSNVLRETGRLREALALLQRISGTGDPRVSGPAGDVPTAYLAAQTGDIALAELNLQQAEARDPGRQNRPIWTVAMWWGDLAAARKKVRRTGEGIRSEAEIVCMERHLAAVARGGVVRGLAPQCAEAPTDWRVRMLSRQGDVDGAYAAFAGSRPLPDGWFMYLFYPEMKAFRRDPRFMPLAHRLGLTDYWLKSGHWPDFCSEPGMPYDCKAVAKSLAAT